MGCGTVSIFWLGIGALIGISAAQKKGWNVLMGAIAGLVLGPFAFLLYFASGIVSSKESQRRKCPHCDEWVSVNAKVCPRCQRDIAPPAAAPP